MLIKSTNDTPQHKGVGVVWLIGDRKLTPRECSVMHGRLSDYPAWAGYVVSLLPLLVFFAWLWPFLLLLKEGNKALAALAIIIAAAMIFSAQFIAYKSPRSRRGDVERIREGMIGTSFVHESEPSFRLVTSLIAIADGNDIAVTRRLDEYFVVSNDVSARVRHFGAVTSCAQYKEFVRLVDEMLRYAIKAAGETADEALLQELRARAKRTKAEAARAVRDYASRQRADVRQLVREANLEWQKAAYLGR